MYTRWGRKACPNTTKTTQLYSGKKVETNIHVNIAIKMVILLVLLNHSMWNRGHSCEVCVLSFQPVLLFQPVNCILWPIRTLNWLVVTSKLHVIGRHVTQLSIPFSLSETGKLRIV